MINLTLIEMGLRRFFFFKKFSFKLHIAPKAESALTNVVFTNLKINTFALAYIFLYCPYFLSYGQKKYFTPRPLKN